METICHSEDSAFSCAPREGKQYKFAGVEVYIKAFKAETKMQWSLMEYHAPPGFKGPAPHYHKIMEEGFYVLEGTVTFILEGVQQEIPAGSFLKVPPNTMHAFSNPAAESARFLVFMMPGGFEDYYEALLPMIEADKVWPPSDLTALSDLLEKYDTFSR
ncbi:MAG: cupin domain-containing protein [Saprospiraceae bacterium]|nr:cupin domain-containing protein [Saprospiraceae bacterium]